MATLSMGAVRPTAQNKGSAISRREAVWGYVFLSPWIIGFLVFTFLPMIASLVLSFMHFTTVHPDEISFIGLANWQQLFTDPLVWLSLKVTFVFALISVPVGMIVPLLVATLLNSPRLAAQNLHRTLWFMPSMVPAISGILIWAGILNTDRGWINMGLKWFFGLFGWTTYAPPDWLNNPAWIYPAFTILGLWGIGNTMLLMLASMQGVPTELYDAAKVDGAGPVASFLNVTVPMISPVIFYNMVLAVIGTLQYFTVPWVMKNGTGDPDNTTLFYVLYLFKNAFTFQQMGFAATLAWLLFIIGVILTVVMFATQRFWVYYAGGEG